MRAGKDEMTWSPPPEKVLTKRWIPSSAIPDEVRKWGFFPETSSWQPGDLILTRSINPDRVSVAISNFQRNGYQDTSEWTHAAIYMGDNLMLCEAQWDLSKKISHVIVTPISEYLGSHEILVKRSRHAEQIEKGWAIAAAAASNIGSKYDVGFIVEIAKKTFLSGFASPNIDVRASSKSFICSTLYNTAHAYVTDVSLSDKLNGLCVPAYLAGSCERHLFDIEFRWHAVPKFKALV